MTLRKTLLATGLLLPLLAFAHDHAGSTLSVEHAWARATPSGAPTGATYFTLRNASGEADRLVGASTPVADKAELHEHVHQDGLMKMRHVEAVEVPADGEVRFAPMGYHVMLFGLKQPLADGSQFPLTLRFERAGEVKVQVPVRMQAPAESAGGGHAGH